MNEDIDDMPWNDLHNVSRSKSSTCDDCCQFLYQFLTVNYKLSWTSVGKQLVTIFDFVESVMINMSD